MPTPAPFAVRAATPASTALIDALPLGIALLDSGGNVVVCNDAFHLSVGCACPSGRPLPEAIVVDSQQAALAHALRDALRGGALPTELRLRTRARPDEPLVLTLAAAPPGVPATLLVAVRDIREQLRLERQVAQVTRMQAIGQLAGGVAHDFNNILAANLGLVEQLMTRHVPGDADWDDLDQLRLNDARGADLVRQLLAFARQQTLRLQVVAVEGVVAELAALLRRLVGSGVNLVLEFGDDVGAIQVDPGQLGQVIVNLAVNARDAMPGGGELLIQTRSVAARDVAALGHRIMPAGDYVEIAVCDTGTGIPTELGAKIFEPFFTTKEVGSGTGLGLSTVYGIVKQSGGFVFNAARPGGGTIFTLFFPRVGDQIAVPPPPRSEPAGHLDGSWAGAQVLLVEDDRAVRHVLRRALQRDGFVVREAADATAALPLIDDGEIAIDVMVSDVMMPGMDGTALAERARARRPALPIVLMSGYAEAPLRDAITGPATRFVAKPFATATLLDAVRGALTAP